MAVFMSHSSVPTQLLSLAGEGVDIFKMYISCKQCSVCINVYRLRDTV